MLKFYREHMEGVWAIGVITVLALFVFVLMWEANSRPTSGTVVDKQHVEEFVHIHTEQTCVSWIDGTCQQYASHTYPHVHPDEYYITIEGFNDKDEFRKGRWNVSEYDYHGIEIGEEWSAR